MPETTASSLQDFQQLVQEYAEVAVDWLLTQGPRILLVIILLVVALAVTRSVIRRLFDRMSRDRDPEFVKRATTLREISSFAATLTVLLVGIFVVLGLLGIEIGPILAAAGVLGLAISFGAQALVSDVISGFFLLIEDQVRVGDVVQIGDKGGVVEKITLRLIILRDLSGNVHFIRNGQVGVVTNMTKDYSRYVFDIGVAYREDVDEVMEVIKEVDEDMRTNSQYASDILEPIELLGVDRFADSAVIVRARTKTKPIMQWAVAREFNRRLKKAFDEKGIEIPFPHVTLYPGREKDGSAPPLHLRTEGGADAEGGKAGE
ncbi:mechanosensitive ion channel family protein [Desulfohalovibrio reitneri]|uniref:mechanosensitive ion channel family protein n=1 Tax=Desulfohalovibrio reitneri TaxID=1307759 RepID=UPI0009DE789D|nr:mechanosensitive ion channel family protein [Desulfohalovibrio reitneri]